MWCDGARGDDGSVEGESVLMMARVIVQVVVVRGW